MSLDLEIAHQRRWPGKPINLISILVLLSSSPGLRLLLIHRFARRWYLKSKENCRMRLIWRLLIIPLGLLKLVFRINSKSDLRHDIEIEDGIFLSDQGQIMYGAIKTGAGTVIESRVTVGINRSSKKHANIGRNVWVGSGCVIYGGINVGNGATLLPGTVLTKSIPPGVVVHGNPARIVQRNFDNSELRNGVNIDVNYLFKIKQEN
ncbi:MAG: Serine acetyltransferase [Pseudomonadota bacterium]